MNDFEHASGGTRAQNALIPLDRVEAGGSQHLEIEGSWQRIETPGGLVPFAPIARVVRTGLLVWGGLSLAAMSGAVLVYAQGGFATEIIAGADAAAPAIEASGAVLESSPVAQPIVVAALLMPPVAPDTALAAAPDNPTSAPEPIGATPADPPQSVPFVSAAVSPMSGSLPGPAQAAAPMATATAEADPVLEARLPRPRPEAPVKTASIERQWSDLRASRHIGRYEAMRPRYLYRYRAAPL